MRVRAHELVLGQPLIGVWVVLGAGDAEATEFQDFRARGVWRLIRLAPRATASLYLLLLRIAQPRTERTGRKRERVSGK